MTVNDNNGTARNVRPITCSTSKHSSMSSSDPSTCYSSSMTPEQVLEMYKQSQRALTQLQPLTDALLSKGFLTGLYCDITVRALGMDFHLHRLVLVQNPYFHALLLGEWREPMAFKMSDQVLHAADGEICRTTLPPHGPPVLHLKFDDANITVEGLNAVFKR